MPHLIYILIIIILGFLLWFFWWRKPSKYDAAIKANKKMIKQSEKENKKNADKLRKINKKVEGINSDKAVDEYHSFKPKPTGRKVSK